MTFITEQNRIQSIQFTARDIKDYEIITGRGFKQFETYESCETVEKSLSDGCTHDYHVKIHTLILDENDNKWKEIDLNTLEVEIETEQIRDFINE